MTHELSLPREEGEGAHLHPLHRELHSGCGGLFLDGFLSVFCGATAHEAGETTSEEAQLKGENKLNRKQKKVSPKHTRYSEELSPNLQ